MKNKFQELEEFKIEALRGEVLLEPDGLASEPANYRRTHVRDLQSMVTSRYKSSFEITRLKPDGSLRIQDKRSLTFILLI